MKQKAKFTFLGTGGSMGIPIIACPCPVCQSDNPHNKRLRPSALIQVKDRNFVIDAGPDFRQQALRHRINHLDGVLFTHAHHDHSGGIDELRAYYIKKGVHLPCLMSKETLDEMIVRFHYVFTQETHKHKLVSRLNVKVIDDERGILDFEGLKIQYMTYEQMGMNVKGFRLGNLAYISDIRHYPESIYDDLKGVEILIISALRKEPSLIHFNVDEAVAFAQKLGVKQAWLTHIAHELDHEEANAYLPSNIRVAYDGLSFDFQLETSS